MEGSYFRPHFSGAAAHATMKASEPPITINEVFSRFFSAIRDDYSVGFSQDYSLEEPIQIRVNAHLDAVKSFAARNFTIHESGFFEASVKFGFTLAIHTIGLIALRAIANNLSWLGLAGVVIAYYSLSEECIDLVKANARKVSDFIGLEDNLLDAFPIQFKQYSPLKNAWRDLGYDMNEIFRNWLQTSTADARSITHDSDYRGAAALPVVKAR